MNPPTMQCLAIDVKCPTCGALAKFEEPFEFLEQGKVSLDETRPCHQWGGWTVIERFPSQFPWQAPRKNSQQYLRGGGEGNGGYPLLTVGLIQCPSCHVNGKHRLHWPADAYWQWEIRGQVLWAWDRSHAEEILAHIRAAVRPARTSYGLRYIPSHFLSAKVRGQVVRKIEQSLIAAAPYSL